MFRRRLMGSVNEGETHIDTDKPGSPAITTVDGEVIEYNLTEQYTVSTGTDTEFKPFTSGKNWEMYISAYFPSVSNNSSYPTILNVMVESRPWPGFCIRRQNDASGIRLVYSTTNLQITTSTTFEMTITKSGNTITFSGMSNTYTLTDTFDDFTIYLGSSQSGSGSIQRPATGAIIYDFYVKEIE